MSTSARRCRGTGVILWSPRHLSAALTPIRCPGRGCTREAAGWVCLQHKHSLSGRAGGAQRGRCIMLRACVLRLWVPGAAPPTVSSAASSCCAHCTPGRELPGSVASATGPAPQAGTACSASPAAAGAHHCCGCMATVPSAMGPLPDLTILLRNPDPLLLFTSCSAVTAS
jgi:hypothetical protein